MKIVAYFGYGANADEEMMAAITGRNGIIPADSAVLEGYQLCIQKFDEMPEKVQSILSAHWTPEFRSYTIKKGDGEVGGTIWYLTEQERELVKNWEIVGLWYQAETVSPYNYTTGRRTPVETERLADGGKAQEVVSGSYYNRFLNDKSKMLEVTTLVRKEFLAAPKPKVKV